MGHGIIVINPYQIPKESVHQANRLKDELLSLGVKVEIVTDAFLRNFIAENKIQTELKDIDFIVYLDKDKYQSEILESLGIKLFNSHKAVRVCDDKGTTYLALINNGLNIPKLFSVRFAMTKICLLIRRGQSKLQRIWVIH